MEDTRDTFYSGGESSGSRSSGSVRSSSCSMQSEVSTCLGLPMDAPWRVERSTSGSTICTTEGEEEECLTSSAMSTPEMQTRGFTDSKTKPASPPAKPDGEILARIQPPSTSPSMTSSESSLLTVRTPSPLPEEEGTPKVVRVRIVREGHPYYTADQPKEAAAEYKGATWEERWAARSAGPGRVRSVPVLLPGGVRVERLATEVVSVDTEFTEVTTSGPPAPAVTQSPGCHGNQQTASKTVSKNGGGEMRGAESRGARETLASWRATLDQACRGLGGAEVHYGPLPREVAITLLQVTLIHRKTSNTSSQLGTTCLAQGV